MLGEGDKVILSLQAPFPYRYREGTVVKVSKGKICVMLDGNIHYFDLKTGMCLDSGIRVVQESMEEYNREQKHIEGWWKLKELIGDDPADLDPETLGALLKVLEDRKERS